MFGWAEDLSKISSSNFVWEAIYLLALTATTVTFLVTALSPLISVRPSTESPKLLSILLLLSIANVTKAIETLIATTAETTIVMTTLIFFTSINRRSNVKASRPTFSFIRRSSERNGNLASRVHWLEVRPGIKSREVGYPLPFAIIYSQTIRSFWDVNVTEI